MDDDDDVAGSLHVWDLPFVADRIRYPQSSSLLGNLDRHLIKSGSCDLGTSMCHTLSTNQPANERAINSGVVIII